MTKNELVEKLIEAIDELFDHVRQKHNVTGEFSCVYFRKISTILEKIKSSEIDGVRTK